MQYNPIYLLANKINVYTNVDSNSFTESYRKMYNRTLKLYRSVDNTITFQVRNTDEKPIDITNSYIVFNLISRNNDLIYKLDCNVVNPLTGLVTVTLYATDIYNLEQGNYSYSIIMQQRTILDSNNYIVTSSKVLYIDSQYGAIGLLDIYGDVLGTIKDSLVVDTFNYINPLDRGVTTIPKNYTSSIINAHPELSTPLSLYTFQFYFTNYTGIVVIQGSIENQGSTPHIWADIVTVNPLLDTIVNVIGKYSWFRIYHQPLTGTLDKVLFR